MDDIKDSKIPDTILKDRKTKINIIYYIMLFMVIFFIQELYKKNTLYETLPYSEFKNLLTSGKFKEVVVSDTEIRGVLKEPALKNKSIVVSTLVDPNLSNELDKFNVKYSRVVESTFVKNVFFLILPTFIFFGNFSTGSSDDIAKVTQIARGIALKYGMVSELGHISYEDPSEKYLEMPTYFSGHKNYSEKVAENIDQKIKELVDEAFEKAMTIIKNNQTTIDKVAKELLLKETLYEEDLKKYFQ